ncbi:MAG: hypothetical protein PVH61_44630 [Candidatus Aminicenantes bacterium]|jgi:hypothetical protein
MDAHRYTDIKAVKVGDKLYKIGGNIVGITIDKITIEDEDVLIYGKEEKPKILFHGRPFTLYFFQLPKNSEGVA